MTQPFEPTRSLSDPHPLEEALNAVSDQDVGWWPFLELRPERHERIDSRRVARMLLSFGPLVAALLVLPIVRFVSPLLAFALVVSCTAIAFTLFRLTFAVAWNRRAARLSRFD